MKGLDANIEVQERDIVLLRDLFVSRVMTLAHIAALHFDGRSEAAKKRVQKLKTAGLIAERPRQARDPSILSLSKQGYTVLRDGGSIADFPRLSVESFQRRAQVSELTIKHELAVMDAKASLAPAIAKAPGMAVLEFTTWPMLCEFEAHAPRKGQVRVKPDGRIRVEQTAPDGAVYEHAFFLEVDRGTESLGTLATKALCYRDYYASGGFAELCGAERAEFREYPFRVLFVLASETRQNNIAERLLALNPPIQTLVWLSTSTEVAVDPLGAVWTRPRDFGGKTGQARIAIPSRRPLEPGRQMHPGVPRCSLFSGSD